MNKTLFVICSAVLVIFMAATTVQADGNVLDIVSVEAGAAIVVPDDTGWPRTYSETTDCVAGWGEDTWTLTLNYPQDLTIRVEDCCVIGDYYEVYIDGVLIGTTPIPGPVSDGSFTVPLGPGVYLIEIRNALPGFTAGCPAGYWVTGTLSTIVVDVDIKGGSCPNPFNPKSKGSVPVAILGSAAFVADIDPTSIMLIGVEARDEYIYEDSTEPPTGDPDDCDDCFDADDPANFNCDLDGDGTDDAYCGDDNDELVVKFDTQALAAAIAAAGGAEKGECVELLLTGTLLDGTPIVGSDSVVVLKAIAAAGP